MFIYFRKLQVSKYLHMEDYGNIPHNLNHSQPQTHLEFCDRHIFASISALRRFGLSNKVTISKELT